MPLVVGIRFKSSGKIYYFDPAGHSLAIQEEVIVDTARGQEVATVAQIAMEMPEDKITAPLRKVIRIASAADKKKAEENQKRAKEAIEKAVARVEAHKLDMRIVDAEYSFDLSKVIFFFISEGRVDFRELVKDLAGIFRTRVELRQIGVRDKAKMVGGLGCCGRPLCCATFLADFEPVSIKMAKEQNLSLNPLKISGVCSRLMCCLKYENEVYKERNREAKLAAAALKNQSQISQNPDQEAAPKGCPDCRCHEKKEPNNGNDRPLEAPSKERIDESKMAIKPVFVKKDFSRKDKPKEMKKEESVAGQEKSERPDERNKHVRKIQPVQERSMEKKVNQPGLEERSIPQKPEHGPKRFPNGRNNRRPDRRENPVTPTQSGESSKVNQGRPEQQKNGTNRKIEIGMLVHTPEGPGKVVNLRLDQKTATVLLDSKSILEFSWQELRRQ